MRIITVCVFVAFFGLSCADASLLQFSATTDRSEIVSFTLDTTVPNTYDPILYPNLPIRAVYLNSVHDLNFEGTSIFSSDAATTPGQTGSGQPLTVMEVGPLFHSESLSLFLIFLDPALVTPLSSDPLAYEHSFEPFQSVLFPQIPPPRTHVDPLLTLTVNEVPEPSFALAAAAVVLSIVVLRMRGARCGLFGFKLDRTVPERYLLSTRTSATTWRTASTMASGASCRRSLAPPPTSICLPLVDSWARSLCAFIHASRNSGGAARLPALSTRTGRPPRLPAARASAELSRQEAISCMRALTALEEWARNQMVFHSAVVSPFGGAGAGGTGPKR